MHSRLYTIVCTMQGCDVENKMREYPLSFYELPRQVRLDPRIVRCVLSRSLFMAEHSDVGGERFESTFFGRDDSMCLYH